MAAELSETAAQYSIGHSMPSRPEILTVEDHRRDAAGMVYVYPVVSRRSGGVSVGINLNPNNACNWRCVYCQVPGLTRGEPPPIDLAQLESELRRMLGAIVDGGFLTDRVEAGARVLSDIAFSGNGEPTSAPEFPEAVAIAARVRTEFGLDSGVRLRLITNGSLIDRTHVREGLRRLGEAVGEAWFKVDGGTAEALVRINGSKQKPATVLRRLRECAGLCETWAQSCFFALDGEAPAEAEVAAYESLIGEASDVLAGVHLYGIARTSCQPEAERLGRLPADWLEALAERLRRHGLTVRVSP
jgi:wyosine [tRNA(Phe)-imidazoG37] synthetase (radical SAM superfamily)